MILPDKNILLRYSILGAGSKILIDLNTPQTVSSLWEKARDYNEINTFEKFVLTLGFLYSLGLVNFKEGIVKKVVV